MVTTVKSHPNIIRGNRADLVLSLKADGILITTLGTALSARFIAIHKKSKTIVIDKALADMSVDSPDTGKVTLPFTSGDTDIDEGRYDIAIQFLWGSDDILEWNFPESLVILKGIIPSS